MIFIYLFFWHLLLFRVLTVPGGGTLVAPPVALAVVYLGPLSFRPPKEGLKGGRVKVAAVTSILGLWFSVLDPGLFRLRLRWR